MPPQEGVAMVILFDLFNLPEDIYEIIFATTQQVTVSKLLVHHCKEKGGELTKSDMSTFATLLHDGKIKTQPAPGGKPETISYNKRQFYDRILTPMKSMGLMNYDLYKKTYTLTDRFNKEMIRIGLMWVKEVKAPLS